MSSKTRMPQEMIEQQAQSDDGMATEPAAEVPTKNDGGTADTIQPATAIKLNVAALNGHKTRLVIAFDGDGKELFRDEFNVDKAAHRRGFLRAFSIGPDQARLLDAKIVEMAIAADSEKQADEAKALAEKAAADQAAAASEAEKEPAEKEPQADQPAKTGEAKGRRGEKKNKGGKRDAAISDPQTEAERYLKSSMADGVSRICTWQGSFNCWMDGRYVEVPTPDIRGGLIRNLNKKYSRVSSAVTTNALDQVRALSMLRFDAKSPFWIHGANGWPADEVLSTPSGLVHLPSFVEGRENYIVPPTPRFFTFSALDYPFVAEPPEPVGWLSFLECLFGDDVESIALLKEWFGLSLLPETRYQKILFIVGPKRSGKGTIMRVLTKLVGEANVCSPTLAALGMNFGLASSINKLLSIISDARLSGRSDQAAIVERMLSISGEDNMDIDRKYLPVWRGKLSTRLVLCTNELPRLHDTSGALASRMLVLQTRKSFLGRENLMLTDELIEELPGILRWAIEGWRVLREQRRFTQPTSSLDVAGELVLCHSLILG